MHPHWTIVLDATVQELRIIDKVTSYRPKGAWFSPAVQKGYSDGITHLMVKQGKKSKYDRFPTGLFKRVHDELFNKGIPVEVDELSQASTFPAAHTLTTKLKGVELRDYQLDAMIACLANGRGVVGLPTGSGKTEVEIALAKALDVPTLYVVHRKELVNQTKERFKLRWPKMKVGVIGDGWWHDECQVTIGMIQSLTSKSRAERCTEFMERVQCIIVDEVHHAPAPTYYRLLMTSVAPFRFGFSATPKGNSGDELMMEGAIGPIIYSLAASPLVERGLLARPIVEFFEAPSPDIDYMSGWEWGNEDGIYMTGIVKNDARNRLIVKKVEEHVGEGRNVLVLVTRIEHGRVLADASGYEFVFGDTDFKDRLSALQRLGRKDGGRGTALIASTILDEGVDITGIDVVVNGAGGESCVRVAQALGRAIRPKVQDGNDSGGSCYFVDFRDSGHRILREHSRKRLRQLAAESSYEIRRG